MKRKIVESEGSALNGKGFPILEPGIGTRIKAAAERIGTRESAASAASVSEDMLYRYIREQSAPSFAAMVGLARAAKVRLDWLATGEGEPHGAGSESSDTEAPGSADLDLLERVSRSVFEELQRRNIQLEPAALARLVRVLYRHFASRQEMPDHATVSNIIDLAAYR